MCLYMPQSFTFVSIMLPYFYHPTLLKADKLITLNEDTTKHCMQVLRMKAGSKLQLTNGLGLKATCTITTEDKRNATVTVKSSVQDVAPAANNTIAISLLKHAARFEWFLEKATELGIRQIIPMECVHTERTTYKQERWQAILVSAMLQSQQTYLPTLTPLLSISEVLMQHRHSVQLIAHCYSMPKHTILNTSHNSNNTIVLIGPEGDFTPIEVDLAITQFDYIPISLGSTRLRTETAGMVAATLLQQG